MSTSIAATSATSVPVPNANPASCSAALSSEERLLALIVYSQTSQMNEAKTSVNLNAEQLERLREQVKKALDEAREAKKDSGFWGGLAKIFGGDLASIASAVAAVAAVVATGGAAAAILAVVAAAATLAADHAKELGIPTEVAMAIAITASVASLCCGDAKGLFKVTEAVKDVAKDVKVVGYATSAAFKIEGAGCGVVAGKYERNAGYSDADARSAEGRQHIVSADIDESLDRLSSALDYLRNAAKLTSSIQQQTSASDHAILNNWGGVA
jgi:hypothetical protein